MTLIVQKYGGTSVAGASRIKRVARRIIKTREAGHQVVVVVSAMGDTTDDLVKMAYQINEFPDKRELDVLLSTGEVVASTLLAMALHGMGFPAISLNGAQAGIRTDSAYSRARITGIDPARILKELEKGSIVIVAGFQGITEDLDITTLGRGGSDTTAVALAAILKAKTCERYTDVNGIYTADPRLLPEARKLTEISYEEMLEMVTYGFKAIHPRAVELGEVFSVPILVASSFNDKPGTLIHKEVSMEIRNKVRGIAHDLDVAKITVVRVPDRPGIAAQIFLPLAEAGISVDTIVQNASIDNTTDLTFTVAKSQLAGAMTVVEPIAASIGAQKCVSDSDLGKVSIIGSGMQNAPGYAARMFDTLSKENINILLITTSEIRITCIIEEARVKDAVKALHRAFELEKAE
ncbi:MAG: aspartate kinase [Chloroflexi bacterium RBG_13_51_18]|nr:MAG: aspartate kinase [Chloroflexi bacterium RBG_13_51_18]